MQMTISVCDICKKKIKEGEAVGNLEVNFQDIEIKEDEVCPTCMNKMLGPVQRFIASKRKSVAGSAKKDKTTSVPIELSTKDLIRNLIFKQGSTTVPEITEAHNKDKSYIYQMLAEMKKAGEVIGSDDRPKKWTFIKGQEIKELIKPKKGAVLDKANGEDNDNGTGKGDKEGTKKFTGSGNTSIFENFFCDARGRALNTPEECNPNVSNTYCKQCKIIKESIRQPRG